jgi:dephospho-CoA kinase
MYIIGLTGGIGSGKTMASGAFTHLGVPVIDLDEIAKNLTKKGSKGYNEIVKYFGQHYLNDSGDIDRRKLRADIFLMPKCKNRIESILHPLIYQECLAAIKENDAAAYIVIVIPLLFETNTYQVIINENLLIDCSEELQLKRVINRDLIEKKLAMKIINSQMKRQDKLNKAENIINNEASKDILEKNILYYHENLLKKLGVKI